MTVIPLPRHGQWVFDSRGEGRSVRVSAHADEGLLNISLWRGGECVGTARLLPADAATLVSGLSEGLAEIAARRPAPVPEADRLAGLEERLRLLESSGPRSAGGVRTVVESARKAWLSPRNRLFR